MNKYYSGVANSFNDLLLTLGVALVDNGWISSTTPDSNFPIAYLKGGLGVAFRTDAKISDSLFGFIYKTHPNLCLSTTFCGMSDVSSATIFPIIYEISIFNENNGDVEIYVKINHNVVYGQHLAFGNVNDNAWLTASCSSGYIRDAIAKTTKVQNSPSLVGGSFFTNVSISSGGYPSFGIGFFGNANVSSSSSSEFGNSMIVANVAGVNNSYTNYNQSLQFGRIGISTTNSNARLFFNSISKISNSPVIIPIWATVNINNARNFAFALQLKHCKLCRMDTLSYGEEITYGNDIWKTYPYLSKNGAITTNQNKDQYTNLGFAIRKI